MSIDLVIKNGKVVTPERVLEADVAVDKGKVVALGEARIFPEAKKTIEAKDKLVFPGGIDSHTHFETKFMGAIPEETWETGTKAAALGGTTTVINFSIQQKGKPLMDSINADIRRAGSLAVVDFALHGCFIDLSNVEAVIDEIPDLVKAGVPSIKEFLIYRHEGWMVDDWALFNIMEKSMIYKGFVGIHAENAYIGEGMRDRLTKEGKTEPKYHPISKPSFVESEAIQRSCAIAEATKAYMYIVHMSTKEGIRLVGGFREKGMPIFSETCTHYLKFTEALHGDPKQGVYSQLSPPLRKMDDVDALCEGLASGAVSILWSDHAPFNKASKEKGYSLKGFITVPTPQQLMPYFLRSYLTSA